MSYSQQSYINEETKRLADADIVEPDEDTGEDHSAHAPGNICKECGRLIVAGQPARLRREAEWVHDVCPNL
jgi:hypothetical protein